MRLPHQPRWQTERRPDLPTQQIELLTTEARRLQAELVEIGFRHDECSPSDACHLWHPTLHRGVTIAAWLPVDVNVVAVQIEATGRHGATTLRVVGIEDLIADQITDCLREDGRRNLNKMLLQVLVELGRAGVGGPFRPAYLQRRLARETGGQAVLEMPLAPCSLDDPASRITSLLSIASVVRNWCASRNLPLDAGEIFGSGPHTYRRPSVIRRRDFEPARVPHIVD
jgi:hypothetical protein